MGMFRFMAMAYALAVFMIAPAWLSADEEPTPATPAPAAAEPAPADEPVATAPEQPAEAPETDPAQPAPAPAAPKPDAVAETKAEPAKKEEAPEPKEEPTAKVAASATVTVSDFKFTPATVTVNEGDTVTFTNQGPTVHTATADDGSFDTGIIDKGASRSATFTSAGTVTFFCEPHPFMKGKVVVQAVSASGGGGSSSDSGSTDSGDDSGSAIAGEETTADDGSGLPATGGETLLIALLGAATLSAGMFLRRRSET